MAAATGAREYLYHVVPRNGAAMRAFTNELLKHRRASLCRSHKGNCDWQEPWRDPVMTHDSGSSDRIASQEGEIALDTALANQSNLVVSASATSGDRSAGTDWDNEVSVIPAAHVSAMLAQKHPTSESKKLADLRVEGQLRVELSSLKDLQMTVSTLCKLGSSVEQIGLDNTFDDAELEDN